MKVRVDPVACTGHGRCYALAPDLFSEDEAGHCVVLQNDVPAALREPARRAEQNCPESAIHVDDET